MINLTGPPMAGSRKKETVATYFILGGSVLAATFWLALVSYGIFELTSLMLWAR
jgi:hypothetical protein